MERIQGVSALGAAGFPAGIFQRADALRNDLLASAGTPSVLRGDLHHFNILRAERADWLAIDPKGLLGDPVSMFASFCATRIRCRLA